MWYCGYDAVVDGNGTDGHTSLGYATSLDGINWTKYIGNPMLTTGLNTWDSINVQDPHVIKQGGIYNMWYGGGASYSIYDQQVGFASSSDGINWVKSPLNPVLTRGAVGSWDATLSSFPSVIDDGGIYKMWYTGRDVDPIPPSASLNYYWELGYATAPAIGINEINIAGNNYITLFPNPAQNNLNIQISIDIKNAELKIYNQLGQIEKRITNINNKNISVEIDHLINGVYFVTIQNGSQQVSSIFIKENMQ